MQDVPGLISTVLTICTSETERKCFTSYDLLHNPIRLLDNKYRTMYWTILRFYRSLPQGSLLCNNQHTISFAHLGCSRSICPSLNANLSHLLILGLDTICVKFSFQLKVVALSFKLLLFHCLCQWHRGHCKDWEHWCFEELGRDYPCIRWSNGSQRGFGGTDPPGTSTFHTAESS